MTNPSPKPACPTCSYELTGLIEPDSSATCPECNTYTNYETAIENLYPWFNIRRAARWLLIPPSAAVGLGYSWFWINSDFNFNPILVFLLMIYLPLTSFLFIMNERDFRSKPGRRHAKPSKVVVILSIIAMTFAALLISAISFFLYLWFY